MQKSTIFIAVICLLTGLFAGRFFQQKNTEPTLSDKLQTDLANCADSLRTIVYACAMHPQVQNKEKGKCPFCGMSLSTSVRNAYQQSLRISMTKAAMQLAQVRTEVVKPAGQQAQTIHVDGEIVPDEARVYHQIAHLPGRIDKLYVNKVGAFVKKGDPIGLVYSKELIAVVEAFEYSKKSGGVLRSAVNNIKSWKVTTDQLNSLDLKSGRYQKAVDIYSDFTGTVLEMMVNEGEYAVNTHMGAPTTLYKIADLSTLWGLFEIHEKELGRISNGQEIAFAVPAYPGKQFSGKISKIYPEIDPSTHRVLVRLTIANPRGQLKPGMLATGTLTIPARANQDLLVPRTAILWTGKKSLVYVKDPNYEAPVFEWREVTLGPALEEHYLIEGGLEIGEEIVVNGALRVDAAAQLERKYSMMNPAQPNNASKPVQLVNN